MRLRLAFVAAALFAAACTGDPSPDADEPPSTDPAASVTTDGDLAPSQAQSPAPVVDGDCERIDRARLVRSESIPGGHRLHVHVTDPDSGEVELATTAECVTVSSERLGVLDASVSRAANQGGATLIVARWAPDDVATSRAVIDTLVDGLPTDERIAVWAWSDELLQVVGATTDRGRIDRRLDAVWSVDAATPLDPGQAADIAAEEWEDHRDDILLGVRSVVFVAPTLDLGDRPDIDRDVVVDHWLVRSGDGGRVRSASDDDEAVEDAAAIAELITTDRRVPLTRIDFCDDGDSLELSLAVGDRELRDFGVGDAAVEHRGATCTLAAPGDDRPQPLSIEVDFDDAQRNLFDDAVAIADELSGLDRFEDDIDPEWTGSISLDGGATSTPFDASFRGQSSIECARRNWSINLDGGDARHPVDATGSDEFLLLSLCNDAGYVNTLSGSAVLERFDVWAQARGAGTFEIDDEPRGVYLLTENPAEDLRFETSRVTTVLRRRYDALGVAPDVEYIADLTSNNDTSVLSTYDELVEVASATSGADMVEELRARFDLDQYLRWTAVMSLLESGDHIDELYFVGSESVDEQHEPIIWFTVNAWDPDDLFAPCHRDGRLAIDDPNGLLSCTEALLDQQLFGDPVIYDLYAEILRDVVRAMTPERFAEIASVSADEINFHFGDPDVVAAMDELVELDAAASTPEAATLAVDVEAERLVQRFTDRRAALIDLLDAYDAAN